MTTEKGIIAIRYKQHKKLNVGDGVTVIKVVPQLHEERCGTIAEIRYFSNYINKKGVIALIDEDPEYPIHVRFPAGIASFKRYHTQRFNNKELIHGD